MPISIPLSNERDANRLFDYRLLPDREQEAGLYISHLLTSLTRYEGRFLAAVSLFDSCESESQQILFQKIAPAQKANSGRAYITASREFSTVLGWMGIAARDGAISIYHFGNTIGYIRQNLHLCPTIKNQVNHQILKGAARFFRQEFPRYEAIRHVVGHAADFEASIGKRESHAHRGGPIKIGDAGSMTISGGRKTKYYSDNLFNRTYFVSYEGQVHGYEISQKTASRIYRAKLMAYSAFTSITNP